MDAKVADIILSRKFDNTWKYQLDDFKTDGELTVEITLNEYRELVQSKERQAFEISERMKECFNLQDKYEELKKKYDAFIEVFNGGKDDE